MPLSSQRRIHVLHVDDEPDFTDLTRRFLEREDDRFVVETATSADRGLERIDGRPPDCVVSDYNMPGMDGLEFLQAVRDEYPDLPFVLFTGKGSEAVASDAISAGVTDYLQKGPGTEQYELLANRIQNVVTARRDAKEVSRQQDLMERAEVLGSTGGWELRVESEDLRLTDGIKRVYGVETDREMSLEEVMRFYEPESQQRIRAVIDDATTHGYAEADELHIQTAGGERRIVEGNAELVETDDDGTLLRGVIRDITACKQRERELAHTHDRMTNIEQLAEVGAWEYDSDAETIAMTDGARRLYGLEPDADACLADVFEDVHPADREQLTDRFTACLETGTPYEIDVRLTTTEGEQRWVTVRGERVDDSAPESVVRGYVRDITGERTRERQLAELNQVSQDLLTAETRQEVADVGARAARDILDLQANAVYFHEADDTLVPVAQTDDLTSRLDGMPTLSVENSMAGRVYRRGELAVVEDARQDPDVRDSEDDLRGRIYLPLADHGVLSASSEEMVTFDQQDLALGELLAGTLVAVLDRIETEQTVSSQQQQLSLFFDESPLGAVQWDDEFRFERLNDRAEEILGYGETELRGESWETVVAEEDRDAMRNVLESLLAADGGTQVVNRNVRQDGETRVCKWHNRAVTDADGSVQTIFSKFEDITDRRELEREFAQIKTIAESMNDAVYVIDEHGEFTYVNSEFIELTGYSEETILGSTPALIKDEETVETAERQLGRLLSDDGPDTVTFETTIWPDDGEPVVCEDHMGVLPYEGDSFNGSVGVLRDISERRRRERELRRERDRLDEFVSVVSHDLRNPLNVAQLNTEMHESEPDTDRIEQIKQAHTRMNDLIDDLLTLARQGETVSDMEPVTLGELAETAWRTVESSHASLQVETNQTVRCDTSRLQQLLENLYRNAVEHGGSAVTVTVGEVDDGFYVEDTGPGIPENEREQVFEPGYSTATDGTGFGLRIVRQVAQAHGWTVRVTESEVGGARFEITGVEFADR